MSPEDDALAEAPYQALQRFRGGDLDPSRWPPWSDLPPALRRRLASFLRSVEMVAGRRAQARENRVSPEGRPKGRGEAKGVREALRAPG